MSNKIELKKQLDEKDQYSIEAGKVEKGHHWDHHRKEHSQFPSPCNNPEITPLPDGATLVVTHVDADTVIGAKRALGKALPKVDFAVIEALDKNGSSVLSSLDCAELFYALGIGEVSRKVKFPRVTESTQDVTKEFNAILDTPDSEVITAGKESYAKGEEVYSRCFQAKDGKVGLWILGEKDSIDPSRPYRDNVPVVVVYREQYKSISIYCDPKTPYVGKGTWAEIVFEGHDKACGSPRGQVMNPKQAGDVFKALVAHFNK